MDTHIYLVALSWMGKFIVILLFADFLSGFLHWALDTYGNPNWKFLGFGKHVVIPNLFHHKRQRDVVKHSYWVRNNTTFATAIIVTAVVYLVSLFFGGILSWQSMLIFFIISSQTNELHVMTHRTKEENGKIITFLQNIYVLQTRRHHALHHAPGNNVRYCVLTNFLNPILDRFGFWALLEDAIQANYNIAPLRGSALRGGL